jgi:poly(3-hydroxybutyrate) depolymerase
MRAFRQKSLAPEASWRALLSNGGRMAGALKGPSTRALAIAQGLVRTRRATQVTAQGEFLRLQAAGDTFYWIPFHGGALLRGDQRRSATALQPGFADAMARVGR